MFLCGNSVFHYTTIEQVNGAIGVLSKALIVSDHADRCAASVQFFQQVHDSFAIAGIEISSRFVRQKNRRFASQGARDSDALLLAAR